MDNAEDKKIEVPGYLKFSKVITILIYIWVMYGIIVLSLRVFLLATSANATTPFVEFIYKSSADYLAPFRGIFPTKPVGETGYVDTAALFAIIMYLLIAWLISSGIKFIQSKIDRINEEEQMRQEKLEQEKLLNHSDNIVSKTTYVRKSPSSTKTQN
ncbi:YggT family protein [Candidatus Saccharibacteria bacterium]|jgi:uncharacterized protein YggT (Ycf19 family)|nr:YggT family protein [Candidatus Saccharibacteria bacterium]